MKNIFKITLLFFAIALLATNCKKDETSTPAKTIDTTIVLDASSHSAWKYYSFETGDTVKIADPSNSSEWDIAFQRYMVKTNGGKSGKGQASSFMSTLKGESGFNALSVVPDTAEFSADDTVKVYGYNPANPSVPSVTNYILNAPLYGWYTLQSGAVSTLVPNNNIYVAKTATGKYVKLWIQSYYKDADASAGFIKIKYVIHKDGSKNLQ